MKTKKELIDEIIFNFDFEKVEKVMKALDWEWFQVGIPSQVQAADQAARLLGEAYDDAKENGNIITMGTGGFGATAHPIGKEIYLELKFIVTQWDTYE